MQRIETKDLVLCALFTALIAVGAYIQIPVPGMDYFTLQFLFVLMAGILLGSKKGAMAVGCYVLLGLFGLPVFAGGGGITYIFRPSFGYLLGFVVAAFVTGFLSEKQTKKSFGGYLLASFGGFLLTYAIGLTYKYLVLNYYMGEKTALLMVVADCFPLDMPGDVVLCFIAAGISLRLVPVVHQLHA